MKITKIEQHSIEELYTNLRKVQMMKAPEHKPYVNSQISLIKMHTDQIAPAQRYVLTQELMKVRDLRWELRDNGYDLFQLDGYLSIWLEGYDDPIDVLPPVIEESAEADGSVVNILNDGMHRVYLARMERNPIQVIYIKDIPKEFPYYAFPLVKGWNDVEIVSELPDGYIKKWHRIREYKTLYRDFNTGFQNVGGPRGHFTNANK
ncbi:MAG: hypothetical protein SNJ70_02925 [Armatimonadota bacterium]